MRRKHYNAIGIDQDIDATCHARGPGHNTARKCRAVKRKTSKRMRQVLRQELDDQVRDMWLELIEEADYDIWDIGEMDILIEIVNKYLERT